MQQNRNCLLAECRNTLSETEEKVGQEGVNVIKNRSMEYYFINLERYFKDIAK